MIGGGGDTTIPSPRRYQNNPFWVEDYMNPYMVGKLAPNLAHFMRGLVKKNPREGLFPYHSLPKRGQFFYIPAPLNR